MKWDGDYDGFRPFKREYLKWRDKAKELSKDKRAWAVLGVVLSLLIYICIPATVIQKDNFGHVISNALEPSMFHEFVGPVNDGYLRLRNSSITDQEFEEGLIQLNTTEGGQFRLRNATVDSLVKLCQHHYSHHKSHNCICLQNFGLLVRGACVNNSGTVDLALNIHLDKEGWSNTNKEYLVNGKLMKVADKTRIIYWKPGRKKVVNTRQLQNICLMVCHEGGLS